MASYEDIAAKAEWEGGLDEALDWFNVGEVPEEIREKWVNAQARKALFESALDEIDGILQDRVEGY